MTPEFRILQGRKKIDSLKKKITLTKPEVVGKVNKRSIHIGGSLQGCSFTITADDEPIANVDAETLLWGDTCAIEIIKPEDEQLIVALAILCDNIVKQSSGLIGDVVGPVKS